MISKQRALFYFVGATPYKDLAEAQKADLVLLLSQDESLTPELVDSMVGIILKNAAEIVDTLTTTPTSRMKARKLHGGTKKHKPKVQAVPLEQK